jgi:hypothetical protein
MSIKTWEWSDIFLVVVETDSGTMLTSMKRMEGYCQDIVVREEGDGDGDARRHGSNEQAPALIHNTQLHLHTARH